jgi:hypothetical protein
MIVVMMSVLLIIISVAVVHFGVKSVLVRAILHRSDIAVWFLHSIFPKHLRACKMSACELFVLCWAPHKAGTFRTRVIVLFYGDELRFTLNVTEYKVFPLFSEMCYLYFVDKKLYYILIVGKNKVFTA